MAGPRSLLYLARAYPVPISSPARLRTFNWLLHLSKHFDIVLVAPTWQTPSEQDLAVLSGYCKDIVVVPPTASASPIHRAAQGLLAEARYLTRGQPTEAQHLQHGRLEQAIRHQVQKQRFEVCFSEDWAWGRTMLHAAPYRVLDLAGSHALHDEQTLEQLRFPWRRLWHDRVLRRVRAEEAELLALVDLVLVSDPQARHDVQRLSEGRVRVLESPAGLNTTYFAPWAGTMDPRKIAFFTSLESPTQRDALLHLHRNLLPRIRQHHGNVHLTVVASNSCTELQTILQQDANVHFTGPLEDVRSELGRSAVAVLPLRLGAGSRSRLAQLLAMGIPTVATPIAVRALAVESGEGVLVARDGDEFVDAVVQVLKDWSLRLDLSQRGREIAEARLSLQATYQRLSELLQAAVS